MKDSTFNNTIDIVCTFYILQDSIYRTFQETESLLEHLKLGTEHEDVKNGQVAGAKMPKVH